MFDFSAILVLAISAGVAIGAMFGAGSQAGALARPLPDPPPPATGQGELRTQIAKLEQRVRQLEAELAEARLNTSVEVDLSELEMGTLPPDDTSAMERRLKHVSHDPATSEGGEHDTAQAS